MSRRILVVDDEAHILQVLLLKLRRAGYDVVTAVDGEEGFEMARKELPDLVITDFQMPYMTGLELCKSLKSHEPTSHIPVLMLTARGFSLGDDDLAIGNIRDVLSKPFSPRAIVQQVEAISDRRRTTITRCRRRREQGASPTRLGRVSSTTGCASRGSSSSCVTRRARSPVRRRGARTGSPMCA